MFPEQRQPKSARRRQHVVSPTGAPCRRSDRHLPGAPGLPPAGHLPHSPRAEPLRRQFHQQLHGIRQEPRGSQCQPDQTELFVVSQPGDYLHLHPSQYALPRQLGQLSYRLTHRSPKQFHS